MSTRSSSTARSNPIFARSPSDGVDAPLGRRARARPRRAAADAHEARGKPALQRRDAGRGGEPRGPAEPRALVRDGAARGRGSILRVPLDEGLRRRVRARPARRPQDRLPSRGAHASSARRRTSTRRSSPSGACPCRRASGASSGSSRRRSRTAARRCRTRSRWPGSPAGNRESRHSRRSGEGPTCVPRSSSRPSSSPWPRRCDVGRREAGTGVRQAEPRARRRAPPRRRQARGGDGAPAARPGRPSRDLGRSSAHRDRLRGGHARPSSARGAGGRRRCRASLGGRDHEAGSGRGWARRR